MELGGMIGTLTTGPASDRLGPAARGTLTRVVAAMLAIPVFSLWMLADSNTSATILGIEFPSSILMPAIAAIAGFCLYVFGTVFLAVFRGLPVDSRRVVSSRWATHDVAENI